jgi:hypothetical protein
VKEPIATDFATPTGQPEHMANSPTWMLDNCVWSAGYGARFRLRGGVWQRDVGLSRGQWGLCQDDYGRPTTTPTRTCCAVTCCPRKPSRAIPCCGMRPA